MNLGAGDDIHRSESIDSIIAESIAIQARSVWSQRLQLLGVNRVSMAQGASGRDRQAAAGVQTVVQATHAKPAFSASGNTAYRLG